MHIREGEAPARVSRTHLIGMCCVRAVEFGGQSDSCKSTQGRPEHGLQFLNGGKG